jgi:beta-lactamase superfamily II metal-dependent hydrolase
MMFSLDVRRARKGDCLLLHFGAKDAPGLIMIDGGPKNVYKPHLKPRIAQIRKARGLAKNDSLPVDLLMVSHVDDDHIQGILDLTKEEIAARDAHQPRLLNVLSFWHNSFDAIIGHEPKELTASFQDHFGAAALSGGEMSDDAVRAIEDDSQEEPEVTTSGLKVLASIEQGFRLRSDAEGLGYPRNPEFNGELVLARKGAKPVDIAPGLKFTVLGPMKPELEALHKKHDEWLRELKKKGKSPAETLAAYIDKSVPNLSSIVVLAEAGGKRMLLTGDARGDKVLEGLQLAGLLAPGKKSKIEIDLLKVPHHGSSNNLAKDFFQRIVARHYVFSGNGEHGNPERESMEMLLAARGEDADYTIHFTYPVAEIDIERKKDWEKEQDEEKARKKKNKNAKVKIRKNWSPAENSLAAFFAAHKKFAKKLSTVDAEAPHLVDLLDPVKF